MEMSLFLMLSFIVNLGVALGAGLYETRMVLPLWFERTTGGAYRVNVAAMRTLDSGRRFWGLVTTVPLTLLTFANFFVALREAALLGHWWVAASLVCLVERLGTFAFFIPAAIRLQKGADMPVTKTTRLVRWWLRLNYVRTALTLTALLLLLRAVLLV